MLGNDNPLGIDPLNAWPFWHIRRALRIAHVDRLDVVANDHDAPTLGVDLTDQAPVIPA